MALKDPAQKALLMRAGNRSLEPMRRALLEHGHKCELEYRFAPGRKWRFDLALPEFKIALEVQGGIFTRGRHVRGPALLKEWEKLNAAAALGWRICYCQPSDVASGEALKILNTCCRKGVATKCS